MALDLARTLTTIKERQWALADIDWEAPGAEMITDEQRPALTQFMADLVWIEQIGGQAFGAMAKKAQSPVLKEIYTYFHAEEQRHANAELALMKRWGMLEDGVVPEPNINIRIAIEWLDRWADSLPLITLGTIIPMLEVALDGALLKFLLDEVHDPVCHQVFAKINADESRHLAVDFAVMEMLGAGPFRRVLTSSIASTLKPQALLGILVYTPLLSKTRDSLMAMGLKEERLYEAMEKFASIGDRSATTRRNPAYQFLKGHAKMMHNSSHPFHTFVGDPLVKITDKIPARVFGERPTWSTTLTPEPVAK